MTLTMMTFLTLLTVVTVSGRWSASNPSWDQQERRGGRGGGGGWVQEEEEDIGVRDFNGRTVMMEVARQVLRLLHQHRQQENRMDRETDSAMTSAIARDTIRLIVMGFMGYYEEDQCVQRVACEAGEVLTMFYPSASLFLAALDLVTPPEMREIVRLAKDASLGGSCVIYRCGEAFYPSDNEVKI